MTRGRWTAALTAACVVVAVTALAVSLARGTTADRPPVLRLGSGSSPIAAAGVAEPVRPGAEPYTLTGTLPTGRPPDAPIWHIPTATSNDAATVAAALHVDAAPTRTDGGWAARSGDNLLAVRDDGSWSFGLDCSPDTPVADEDLDVGCAVATAAPAVISSPGAAPSPLPTPSVAPGPDDATARTTADTVMHALGYDGSDISVSSADPASTVTASPRIDGTPAPGWATTMQVDGAGTVVSANGWIGTPRRGDDYPLITAQRAFELLQQQPRPMMELCMRRPDGKPGCADVPPTEITGASLGLTLDRDGTEPVLVPAWLFAVRDQDYPLVQVAVDPAYLAQPTPQPVPVEKGGAPAEPPTSVAPAPAQTP